MKFKYQFLILNTVSFHLINAFLFPFKHVSQIKHKLASTFKDDIAIIKDTEQPVYIEPELKANSKIFDWGKQWYPVAVEEFTDKAKPHKFMFMGNDIVIWNDGKQWRAFEDSCPHRGVPLSEGRVEANGELLCAYHAWKFDGEGKCTSIPQTLTKEKEAVLQSKACVSSYPVQVLQGLIWVWGEKGQPGSDVAIQAKLKPPRLIDELSDPKYAGRIGRIVYNFRDLPYGWDMFMENVLDPAHVVVSHHGIVGNRYTDPQYISMTRALSHSELPVESGGGLLCEYPEDAGFKYIVQPKMASNETISSNDFRPPCLNKIETYYKNSDSKMILALYATPTKPGYCRHIGAQILIKDEKGNYPPGLGFFALPLPKWLLHVTASLFLHQDAVFLHHQERMLYSSSNYAFGNFSGKIIKTSSDFKQYSSTYFMPNSHDKQISHLRSWIHRSAGGGVKWGSAAEYLGLPKRLPEEQLFDVYNSHTKDCSVCSKALKNLKLSRNVSIVLSILAIGIFKSLKLKIIFSTLTSVVSLLCHKLMKMFYKYEYSHQSNK